MPSPQADAVIRKPLFAHKGGDLDADSAKDGAKKSDSDRSPWCVFGYLVGVLVCVGAVFGASQIERVVGCVCMRGKMGA